MSLPEEIKDLKNHLTGDKKKDIDMLFKVAEKYEATPYNKAVTDEISSLLNDILRDADAETLISLTSYVQQQSSAQYEKNLFKVRDLIGKEKTEEALALINTMERQVLQSLDDIQKRDKRKYDFRICYSVLDSRIEEKCFPSDNIIELPFDYVSLLAMKAQTYFALHRYDEAFFSLREAISHSPTSVDLLLLKADMDQQIGNIISFKMDIDAAKRFIYKPKDMQRYLLYIAKYYETVHAEQPLIESIRKAAAKSEAPYQMMKKLPGSTLARLHEDGFETEPSDELEKAFLVLMREDKEDNDTNDYLSLSKTLTQYIGEDKFKELIATDAK